MIKLEIQILPPRLSPQCWSLVHPYLVPTSAVGRGQHVAVLHCCDELKRVALKTSCSKDFPQFCHLLNHVIAQNIL